MVKILSIIWIIFYAYRLLVEKLPRDVLQDVRYGKIIIVSIALSLIGSYSITLYGQWMQYEQIERISTNKLLLLLKKIIYNIYIKPISTIWYFLLKRKQFERIIQYICYIFGNYIISYKGIIYLIILNQYIPKLIAITVLFIEMVFKGKLLYFYSLFPLILYAGAFIPFLKGMQEYQEGVLLGIEKKYNIKREQIAINKFNIQGDNLDSSVIKAWVQAFNSIQAFQDIINVVHTTKVLLVVNCVITYYCILAWLYCLMLNLILV